MISHKKQSLFDAPKDSIIIHACNSMGVWGSGIAKEFKARYPYSYSEYHDLCNIWNSERHTACGVGFMSSAHIEEPHWVGWIVTSHNYGAHKDDSETIKVNTTLALQSLCKKIYRAHPEDEASQIDVYSNKFNSGLFGVHWEDSELILKIVLRDFKRINWIVCSTD